MTLSERLGRLAAETVEELFTDGQGEHAERLVLMSADGRDLGGYSRRAVTDRIVGTIRATLAAVATIRPVPPDL